MPLNPDIKDVKAGTTQVTSIYQGTNPVWVGDEYWDKVVLLCHFDGTNGQTTTVDSSSYARALTREGSNSELSSAQKKFGPTSYGCGGDDDAFRANHSAELQPGSQDFTIEGWVRISTFSAPLFLDIVFGSYDTDSNERMMSIGFKDGDITLRLSSDGTDSGTTKIEAPHGMSTNTWYHIAGTREGNTCRVFVDGALLASDTFAGSVASFSKRWWIANGKPDLGYGISGYMDELRYTVGAARYTAPFTPPDKPFPDY